MPILQFDIYKAGYGEFPVLTDVSFAVQEGEIVFIIGPNGSGKSTLLKCAVGLATVSDGSIFYSQRAIHNINPNMAREYGIAYSPQMDNVFPNLTVAENILVGTHAIQSMAERKHQAANIFNFFPELALLRRNKVRRLSGGQKQLVSLSMALASRPRILLLDEPMLGIHERLAESFFLKLLSLREKEGLTIVIVEQRLKYAFEYADRIAALKMGALHFIHDTTSISINDDIVRSIFQTD